MRESGRSLLSVAMPAMLLALSMVIAPSLAAAGPTVIKLWDVHIHDKKFRQNIFKEFNKANPDIKVEYTSQVSGPYDQMMEAAFRTDNAPDIFMPATGGIAKMIELGRVIPLDDVAPSKPDLDRFRAQFPKDLAPFLENVNLFKGKTYSWPIAGVDGPAYIMLYYNTKLFRNAGLTRPGGESAAPETWADLRLSAKKITELDAGKTYGMVFGGKNSWVWKWNIYYTLAFSTGWSVYGWWGLDFRTGRYDYHHPGFRSAIQVWLDMKKDGSIFPGTGTMDDEQAKYKFSQDLAGMIFDGPWTPGGLVAINPDLEFDAVLSPTQVRGERKGTLTTGRLADTSEYVVSSKITNSEAIWRVITFMTSQRYQEEWVKAGGGISAFPEYNKPEFFPHPTIAKIARINASGKLTFQYPDAWYKIDEFWDPGRPDVYDTTEGQWIGQLGWDAWDAFERRANDAMDKAMAEANKKYGTRITQADFIFPGWDPAK